MERNTCCLRNANLNESDDSKIMNSLHTSAYGIGGTLGNPLRAPERRNGLYLSTEVRTNYFFQLQNDQICSIEQMSDYLVNTHTKDRVAVVGMGISHTDLMGWLQNAVIPQENSGDKTGMKPTVYIGGEDILDTGASESRFAIVSEGAK